MRNLKRALSLALAVIMVLGLMIVGAGAVSYNDFSDREEIVNKDAVSMLTTLGIINGMEDGSYFAPTEGVDRAMMAKMISVIMNQGVDNSTLYTSTVTGLTDVSSSWALGHINFCYTRKIIAGRGNGTFDPAAGVTAVEAAKMLLVAAGYDPAIEGFEGADWAINVNAKASALGIFRNFTKDVTLPLSRDDAALLIYNALDVEMIQKYENGYAIAFTDHRTILSTMYGVYKVEGVVTANEWAQLEETDSDAALREGRTTLENVIVYSSTTANTTTGEGVAETAPVTFNVSTPVDMLGKTVTMYIEKTTILSNSKVLGVSTKDDVNVINFTVDGDASITDFLKGTGVAVDRNTEYYVNYGYCADQAEAFTLAGNYEANAEDAGVFAWNGVEVEVIDNNDDGIVEYVLFLRETLSEVSRYNATSEILSFHEPNTGADDLMIDNVPQAVSVPFDEIQYVDAIHLSGMKLLDEGSIDTDDLFLYVQYGGRTYVAEPEIVTGLMTRVDRNRAGELYITVDNGEEYYESFIRDAASDVDVDVKNFDINSADLRDDEPGFTVLHDFILDSNGYLVAIRPAEEVVVNYALVLDSAWTQNALAKSGQVEILMADGTTGTYTINWNASDDAFDGVAVGNNLDVDDNTAADLTAKLETYLGTRDVWYNNQNPSGTGMAAGTVITYTLNDENILTIRSVMQGNSLAKDEGGYNNVADARGLEIVSPAANVDSTAGVGDNGAIIYANNAAHNANACDMQYTVVGGYDTGDGSITVDSIDRGANAPAYVGATKTYAVDRNTVAFYVFSDNNGNMSARVLTGWNAMSDVDDGTHAQVYPVLTKTNDDTYAATNLAGVIVFEAETRVDNDDWMLVLNRNAYTSGSDLWLNVVFEDGTVKEIQIDDDNGVDFDQNNRFMRAYTYVENKDGTYDITCDFNDSIGSVYADLLVRGTVATAAVPGGTDAVGANYIAISDNANVWDVTDVTSATDEVVPGTFRQNVEVFAVNVVAQNGIRTSWIWDVPVAVNPGDEDTDYYLTIDTIAPHDGDNTTDVTVTLWDSQGTAATEDDTVVGGEAVDYTYKVEILSANGNWVEAMTGEGDAVTNAVDGDPGDDGQAVINIRFDSTNRANSYRVTVSFYNRDIGTVSDTQVGA